MPCMGNLRCHPNASAERNASMADSLGNGAGSAGRALPEAQPSHKLKSKLERQHAACTISAECLQVLGHANIKAVITAELRMAHFF